MKKLSNPYVFIGVLLLTVIVSGLMCNITTANTNNTNSIMVANGSTVVSGDLLIDTFESSINMIDEPADFKEKLEYAVKIL